MKDTEIYRNVIFLGQVNVNNAYDFPTTAGTTGQVLSYDGSGNLVWTSIGALSVTTSDIAEGVNLYFTQERAEDVIGGLIQNGTGLTWTYNDSANTMVGNVSLSGFDTDNLSEGTTNLYFTDERVDDRVSSLMIGGTGISLVYNDTANTLTASIDFTEFTTDDVVEGTTNLYLTNERVDDRVNDLIQNGTGITWNYNDGAGLLTPTISLSSFDTDNLSEGTTNLYFTNERVDDRVYSLMTDTSSVTWTYNDVSNTLSATAAAVLNIQKGGTTISSRDKINFIEGTGITINVADDGINSRSNVTISTTLSQNLASDNLTQDSEARTYNMNNQNLTFNNGYFKVIDSGFGDMLYLEHGGGDITFGGASGVGTGGSNWVHQTNFNSSSSTSWEHRDFGGNVGLKLVNWTTTGGLNQYTSIEYAGSGSMYILNNGGGAIQLGTTNTINVGYGTGSGRPETVRLKSGGGEFVMTGTSGGTGSTTFTDDSGTKAGIEYAADYSSTFSGLSLINRDFADATYAPLSTSTSAGSGLTLTSGVINLGGALTLDADIEGTGPTGFNLSLGLNVLNKNLNTFNINAKEKYEKYSSGSFPYSTGGSSLSHDEQGVKIDVDYATGVSVKNETNSEDISKSVENTNTGIRTKNETILSSQSYKALSLDLDNNEGTALQIGKDAIGIAAITTDYSTSSMKFEIDASGGNTTFTDSRSTKKGIEYAADYQSGYTDRTLIDRGFANVTYAPIASGITNGDKGDITVSGGGATWTIDSGAVGFNKIQTIDSQKILGRYSAGAGNIQELTIGTGLSLSGTGTLSATSSSSSGQIGVIRDTDNGTPTYFSDLQTALETCKAANINAVVTLYDNITLTSGITMNVGGSASTIGEGYLFSNILIDFNGFTVTYGGSGTDPSIYFLPSTTTSKTLNLINGSLKRTTGAAPALAASTGSANLIMSNMYISSSISHGVYIQIENSIDGFANFGNSVFESSGSGHGLYIEKYSAKSFTGISGGGSAVSGIYCANNNFSITSTVKLTDFTAINTGSNSSDHAINLDGDWDLSNFHAKSNSGNALNIGSEFEGSCTRFDLESSTGKGISGVSGSGYVSRFSNFTIDCSDNICIDSNSSGSYFSNFFVTNNSTNFATITHTSGSDINYKNGTSINHGTTLALNIVNVSDIIFKNCNFISIGGAAVMVSLNNSSYSASLLECTIESRENNSGGHGVQVGSSNGLIEFANCDVQVKNNGASCFYSSSSRNISLRGTAMRGATTPLVNMTLSHFAQDIYGNTTT